jgi:hypothetical protein
MTAIYDELGNGLEVGATLQGFGLNNAGRYYTVLGIGKGGRIRVQRHIDSKDYWVFFKALSARVVTNLDRCESSGLIKL